jgi:hypothetical protein
MSGPPRWSASTNTSTSQSIEASSAQPPSAGEIEIESSVAESVPGGPPAHWLERVRQGAPQLLQSVPHASKRARPAPRPTSIAEKTAALAQVPENRQEKPSDALRPSAKKELATHANQADIGVACSTSEQSTQYLESAYPGTPRQRVLATAVPTPPRQPKGELQPLLSPARPQNSAGATLAKRPVEPLRQSPKSLHASSVASQGEHVPNRGGDSVEPSSRAFPERLPLATAPPTASSQGGVVPPRLRHGAALSSSLFEGVVKAAPSGGGYSSIPREPSEDRWPELPETAPTDPLNEALAMIRRQERLRRLDAEQRGIYGTRRIFA